MPHRDFQNLVVGELRKLRQDVGEVKTDVRTLKQDQGRVILAAYESGWRDRDKDDQTDDGPPKRTRFTVLPGGRAIALALLLTAGVLGAGGIISSRTASDDTRANPSATATATNVITATVGRNPKNTGSPSTPESTTELPTTPIAATSEAPRATVGDRVRSVRQGHTDRADEPLDPGPSRPHSPRPPKPTPRAPAPTSPATTPPPQVQSDCVARAKVLGIEVSLLCS